MPETEYHSRYDVMSLAREYEDLRDVPDDDPRLLRIREHAEQWVRSPQKPARSRRSYEIWEDDYITDNYMRLSLDTIARHLQRTTASISTRIGRLHNWGELEYKNKTKAGEK
ncbi:hypothetical protein [Lactobacillus selangorensis]|uniref:hypothetical protein n=1 Tax=Lactobacillus selangorensis TaxID=81857 RepID=UPI00070C6DFF|nr:hypothetical protein [Lactobacillus selangorensis]